MQVLRQLVILTGGGRRFPSCRFGGPRQFIHLPLRLALRPADFGLLLPVTFCLLASGGKRRFQVLKTGALFIRRAAGCVDFFLEPDDFILQSAGVLAVVGKCCL